jgi:hypothetical protein
MADHPAWCTQRHGPQGEHVSTPMTIDGKYPIIVELVQYDDESKPGVAFVSENIDHWLIIEPTQALVLSTTVAAMLGPDT